MTRLLCAAVLSTLIVNGIAKPHNHQHAHLHKKDVDYNNPDLYNDVDWDAVNWSSVFNDGTPAAAATAAPEATAEAAAPSAAPAAPAPAAKKAKAKPAPAAASPSAAADTTSGASNERTGFGGITSAIANGNVDEYIGNVGIPYGSNIIKVSNGDAYQYTNSFQNAGSSAINVIIWNKSGPDGQANSGQFSEPSLSFGLAPGASQLVAFDKNSQVAFCQSTGAKTEYGANDCTYGEADFGNESNGGWSGYDVSSIQNTNGNDTPISISSPNGATSSNSGNNYVSDSQPGGIGGNLAPGDVRLTTVFG